MRTFFPLDVKTRSMAPRDRKAHGAGTPNLSTPTDLGAEARNAASAGLTNLLADGFALFVTWNFHWHVSAPHFRDHHLLLDDQAALVFAMVDPVAGGVQAWRTNAARSECVIQAPFRQRRCVCGAGGDARRTASRQ
ncbi:hypothetical protein [Paraburkholderia sp. CNPSo 3274]|uniref:hypothetical protein n=1 Tax=Paraburkholderia sp. CNPSo 3274 TaxID=2940932 RepID=UPI00281529E1|nr:hypothetical protein [Paraburkholderia sp. CNPSo 3274]